MIDDIKNFPINWIDGMKISKDHFNQLQSHIHDLKKDSISIFLTHNDYGFLPSELNNNADLSVTVDTHNNLKVTITRLKAVTPNGKRIEITSLTPGINLEITLDKPGKSKDDVHGYILLNVNSEEKISFGEENLKEMPPRKPWSADTYSLTFITKKEIEKSGVSGNQLPIGKVLNENEAYTIASDYIPPSNIIKGENSLVNFFNTTEGFLNSMESLTIQIIQKVRSKQVDNPIAETMLTIAENLNYHIAANITKIKWENYHLKPRHIFEILISNARIFKNIIDSSSSENKEQLLNYFGEWTDMKGGDYEVLFSKSINMKYYHYDLNNNTSVLTSYMNTIIKLFTILTQIDYIGKRREMGIFVNENIVLEGKSGKSGGPSLLAE